MRDWLEASAARRPDGVFLATPAADLTFAAFDLLARRTGGALREMGVRKGDRVAVWAAAEPATVAVMWAVPRLGAALVPLDVRLGPAEAARRVEAAEAMLVVGARGLTEAGVPSVDPQELHQGDPAAPIEPDVDDIHSVVFTSGTSGTPKGVLLTWGNLEASAAASALHLDHGEADRWLGVLPLHHVGGWMILVRSARQGSTVVLEPGFDPGRAASLLREGAVTLLSLVATMLHRLLDEDPGPYRGVRAVLLGGGPAAPGLLEAASTAGLPVLPSYGMTETCSQVATLPLDEGMTPRRRARALSGVELRIVDDAGRTLPAGEVGTIAVRGPMLSPGYLGAPRRRPGDWYLSGDVGLLDSDGYLRVVGRADDVIISGGENVDPAEVEAVLLAHPAVQEAAVFGTPHDDWGEAVSALLVAPGAGAEELEGYVRARLTGYKVPRRWAFTSALPRDALGKVSRAAARDAVDEEVWSSGGRR